MAEVTFAQMEPDRFHRIEFRAVGGCGTKEIFLGTLRSVAICQPA